jgi:putative exosortase-associated protein (TIGR04073 family)
MRRKIWFIKLTMKSLLLSLIAASVAVPAMADIQDPPMHKYDSTRKLGRAWANILYASAEIPLAMKRQTDLETDSAGAALGFVIGVRRMAARMGSGALEFLTFPFPLNHGSFRPMLPSKIPWVNGGYEEFPPEWGFQSRKRYCTTSDGY